MKKSLQVVEVTCQTHKTVENLLVTTKKLELLVNMNLIEYILKNIKRNTFNMFLKDNVFGEYSCAAKPPVRDDESHRSGPLEPFLVI